MIRGAIVEDVRTIFEKRNDTLFVEIMEAISIASFLSRDEKKPWVRLATRKTDTLKALLMILWETKSLDNKKYILVSENVEEVGRMLGGWLKSSL